MSGQSLSIPGRVRKEGETATNCGLEQAAKLCVIIKKPHIGMEKEKGYADNRM